jgi:hypothetical protein
MLPSLSTHPLVSSIQKKSLLGVGGVFLTKGKRELEAPTQGEAMTRRKVAAGVLSGRGDTARSDATTKMRGQHNKRRHNNQTARQKAKAHQEVVAQQEAT